MTRKRYVKLLMAQGVSRNLANACAASVVQRRVSYQSDYPRTAALFKSLYSFDAAKLAAALSDAVSGFVSSFQRAVKALAAGFDAFGKAYRSALEE